MDGYCVCVCERERVSDFVHKLRECVCVCVRARAACACVRACVSVSVSVCVKRCQPEDGAGVGGDAEHVAGDAEAQLHVGVEPPDVV